ncbi:MAG: hypothetical protein ACK5V3_16515 [Bdellovibrionales bacterium]
MSVTDKKMILKCNSDTGTDGDLVFEIPVLARTSKIIWKGLQVPADGPSTGEINESYKLVIDTKLKSALFSDVTDYGPLKSHEVQISKSETNKFDIKLNAAGYRIVINGEILSEDQDGFPNQILAADSYNNDLGLSYCWLNLYSHNDQLNLN